MRDGIVGMDQIEFLESGDFNNFACERRSVQWKFKHRIACHFHFVIEHIAQILIEPHRHCIANEMYLMTSGSQRLSELGCDDAAPTVRGVTHNADLHDSILSAMKIYKGN